MEWTGSTLGNGYPQTPKQEFGTRSRTRQIMAEMHGVEAIKGKVVRHTCDNPICVNPEHLLLGTQAENMQDCVDRGRHIPGRAGRKGEAHHSAKLTESMVISIRQRLADGEKRQALADEFGLSYWTVRDIEVCHIWRHIP
jgi:hypothetical protein